MGEIATDMINGYCCSHCNVYFEEEHGYPVLCSSCYIDDAGISAIIPALNPEL